jgi:hypothetical protein
MQSIARENIWKEREAQNDAIQWGVDVGSMTSLEEGWPSIPVDVVWPSPLAEEPLRADGWPSVEGGVAVDVEVCSDVVDFQRDHSACRLLMIIGCLSVTDLLSPLCHRTIGTFVGSCALCCCSSGRVD